MNTIHLLPELTPEQYQALKTDIEKHGILVPVIRSETGLTIDGHHREKIAGELGITNIPEKVIPGLTEEERRHMAIRLNANRRQLNADQKRHLIREELKRSPDLSNNWLAEILGVDDKTVQSVRLEMEDAGSIEPVSEFRCKDGKRRKYRRTTRQNIASEIKQHEAPALLATSTKSAEQQAVASEPAAEPIILPVRNTESAPEALPLALAGRNSVEEYLAGRMAAHGITGTTAALVALLEELGVGLNQIRAA